MQINLEKRFPLDTPAGAGWQVLSDIEAVASCMPGAEITERVDDSHFKGKVKAKVGPATMAFNGTIEVLGVDAGKRELRLSSKGQDSKGSSSAQMDLTARVVEGESGTSELKGEATVVVNGKIASLGGRLMNQVADQILNQFGKNFATKAGALAGEGSTAASPSHAGETAEAEPEAINGLAFAWSVIVGFFRSLFGKKPANAG
jgi:carbon monoxide dehydrogenase subunit G